MDLIALCKVAITAARAAGKVIQQHQDDDLSVSQKTGGTSYASQVVTIVDKACEKVILDHILPTCDTHDLALLSEETEDDGSRLQKDFFWCIDPLDGTLSFIEKRPGYSVSIALVARDGTPCIGVVFDPSTDTLYHAVQGQGAFKQGKPWSPNSINTHFTYVTDRKLRDTPQADIIMDLLQQQVDRLQLSGIEEMDGAGSVLNAIRVLENGPALMLKLPKDTPGGGSIWDFAATACIFRELGRRATTFGGGRLDLNRPESTFMNHEGVFFVNL